MLFDDLDNYQTFKDLLFSTEKLNRNYSSSTSSISSSSSSSSSPSPSSSDDEEEEEKEGDTINKKSASKRNPFELEPIKPTTSPSSPTRQSLSGLTVSGLKVEGVDDNDEKSVKLSNGDAKGYDRLSRAETEENELEKRTKSGGSSFKGLKSLSSFVDDEAVEDNDYNEEEYKDDYDEEYDSDYDDDDDDSFVRTGDKLTASDYDSAASDYPSDPDDDDDDWILSKSEGESSDSYISGLSGAEDNEERANKRAMENAILDKLRKRKRNRGLHRLKRRLYSSSSDDNDGGGGGGEQDDRKRVDADGPRKNRKRKKANSDKEDDD